MKITLLYFGRPAEKLGIHQESVEVPDTLQTLHELTAWLGQRGEAWAHELAESRVQFAINQTLVARNTPFAAADEIAVFSPISGG